MHHREAASEGFGEESRRDIGGILGDWRYAKEEIKRDIGGVGVRCTQGSSAGVFGEELGLRLGGKRALTFGGDYDIINGVFERGKRRGDPPRASLLE